MFSTIAKTKIVIKITINKSTIATNKEKKWQLLQDVINEIMFLAFIVYILVKFHGSFREQQKHDLLYIMKYASIQYSSSSECFANQ